MIHKTIIKTRDVYHKQHSRIVSDQDAMKRFIAMFSSKYFLKGKISKNFIKKSKILDIGCGDTAKVSIALSKLGANNITLADVGKIWMPNAKKSVTLHTKNKYKFDFKSASVTDLPFKDGEFNFTVCHGVLIHLPDLTSFKKAIKELCRVTAKGGAIYIVGGNQGGLLENYVIPSVRTYYNKNKIFKEIIDNLEPKTLIDLLMIFEKYKKLNFKNKFNLNRKILSRLIDNDLCVTIQNLIQAPVRLDIKAQTYVKEFQKYNAKKYYRLARYVPQNNLRNFVSHLHYLGNLNNIKHIKLKKNFSNIINSIYGSGNLEFVFWKQKQNF